jgi:TolA-binding protein
MTHKSNKEFLPPSKSDREYEYEIAQLQQEIADLKEEIERLRQDNHDLYFTL